VFSIVIYKLYNRNHDFVEIKTIVSIRSPSPRGLLAYPPPGCGNLVALRVVGVDERLHIVVVNVSSKSIVGNGISAYRVGDWYRGFMICNGTVFELINRKHTTIIYQSYSIRDGSAQRIIARVSHFDVPSMLIDKQRIILLGINGATEPPQPVLLVLDVNGTVLAKYILPWDLRELADLGIDTRLFMLKPNLYLAAFAPREIWKSKGRGNLYVGIITINDSCISASKLMVLPGELSVASIDHALINGELLYILYSAPGKLEPVPAIYVYNVSRAGKPIAVYSNASIEIRGGFLVHIAGEIYSILLSPLLVSAGLVPAPVAAATAIIVKAGQGLPIIDKIPVKANKGFVDWEYNSLNVPLRDLDGNGKVDVLAIAFSVFNVGVPGEQGRIYLIDIEPVTPVG
jgi:hypothetical protein